MDLNFAIKELSRELARAKRAGVKDKKLPPRLSHFDKARAQHIINRVEQLSSKIIKQTNSDLPDNYEAMESALLDIHISPATVDAPRFPHSVNAEMRADFEEMSRCIEAKCFRSSIILCGRMLETALHCKYFDATGNDLLEKSPGIGLGNLIAKLANKGVLVDPALGNQIHLINQVRIHSVHKKKALFAPSEDQAKAVVMYTMDAIRKLFDTK